MELGAIIVMLIVLLALSGVVIFLVWDYMKYKDTTNTNFADTTTRLQSEKTDRLSNMKYIVDQVNTVNTDIYNTFSSNQQMSNNRMSTLEGKQDKIVGGLGKFVNFTSNAASTGNISIMDLPGFVAPDVRLIQHVTAVSGLTISQLNGSSNSAMFCSASDPTRCIKFPDNNGNTYLTSMAADKKVVIDAESDITNTLNFKTQPSGLQYASLSAFDNQNSQYDLRINANNNIRLITGATGKVGISTGVMTPTAALHVASSGTGDVFKAESLTSPNNPVYVDSNGALHVNSIVMGKNNNVTINASPAGDEVTITAPAGIVVRTPSGTTQFKNSVIHDIAPTVGSTP